MPTILLVNIYHNRRCQQSEFKIFKHRQLEFWENNKPGKHIKKGVRCERHILCTWKIAGSLVNRSVIV